MEGGPCDEVNAGLRACPLSNAALSIAPYGRVGGRREREDRLGVSVGRIEAAAPVGHPRRADLGAALMWASLVPVLLLLHPYEGLIQDARIYIGRGVADLDPAGVGRDMVFAHDAQTGFSLMSVLVGAPLKLLGAGQTALTLTLIGVLLWLAAVAALARGLAPGRVAWAAAIYILALPTRYGAHNVFSYAEAIATPRVFAQAAVIGGLAAMTTRRRALGAALLVLAAAFHPLVALPGFGIGALMLVREERRRSIPMVAAAAAIAGAGLLGLPLANRLFQPMDPVWLSILRDRSTYLFPGLWPAASFGPIVCQATALIAAAAFSAPRVRDLLVATLAVAVLGVMASWLFGDLYPSTLIVQIQPWRALWPLAVLGNAAFALAAVEMWRRGTSGRLGVAALALTWLSSDDLPLALALASVTFALVVALRRNVELVLSRPIVFSVVGLVTSVALVSVVSAAFAVATLMRSAEIEGGEVLWPMVVGVGVQTVPLVGGALAVTLLPERLLPRSMQVGVAMALVCAFAAAAWLWDARSFERRLVERGGSDAALRQAIGVDRGDVLWVDEDSETWFLAGHPSFLNTAQAGPILFSRELAIEWSARAKLLLGLGLVRPEGVAPWTIARRTTQDLPLTPEAVTTFCADPRRPAALVVPGDRRGSVPAAFRVSLWRPPEPIRRLVVGEDALHWQTMAVFTIVGCEGARA